MSISVCTLAFGRAEHFSNLVRGLVRQTVQPDELIIAVMQAGEYDLPPASFPIRQIILGDVGIPLAEARNRSAEAASGTLLVFLDVDCIPGPDLVKDYAAAMQRQRGVFMGEVAYLPKGATDAGVDFARFERVGVRHSERPGPPEQALGTCRDYRCFWSLNFALRAEDFQMTGGFDEKFVGYGGEDTDFARTLTACDIPLWWVRGAKVYHQYHPHHMPPVHHLDSVLANAHRFLDKWGHPTMQHWLRAFVLMGLVERDGDRWVKLRDPGEAELALTRQQADQPYASSSAVLEALEASANGSASFVSRAAPSMARS